MFSNKKIRGLSGQKYTFDEFVNEIKELDDMSSEFFIGTDSQIIKKKISIVTCVCACHENGNRVFYVKEYLGKKELKKLQMPEFILSRSRDLGSLRLRMLLEAYRSIEAAMEVEPLVTGKLNVHLDVGQTSASKTSALHKELEFLVSSQGYGCSIKPHAWAASAVADKVAKKRSR